MLRITYLLLGLVFLCGCGSKSPSSTKAPIGADELDGQVLELFGGQAGWKPLAEPVRVEAFRVKPFRLGQGPDPEAVSEDSLKFAEYPIISGPVEVDEETARKLARILADSKAYGWDFAKSCEFMPGVGFRFVGADSTTEILFCFSCDEMRIVHNGKQVGHEDTDAVRTALVKAVQKIFPDDKVVQGLKTSEELE